MSSLVPLFVDLSAAIVVVTGNGAAADAAAGRLSGRVKELRRVKGMASANDLAGARMLVAAAESDADDAVIIAAAREGGLLVVTLPGVAGGWAHLGESVGQGGVAIAVTTSGRSLQLEARLARAAATALEPHHERFAEILERIRPKLEERFPDAERRDAIWQQILDSPVIVLLQSGMDDDALEMAERMAWGTG